MKKLLNINSVPFTTYNAQSSIIDMTGRYLGFNIDYIYKGGVFIKPLYDDDMFNRLGFRLSFIGQDPDGVQSEMKPEVLTLSQGDQQMQICFSNEHTMRFYGKCTGFSLKIEKERVVKYNGALLNDNKHIEVNVCYRKAMLYTKAGIFELDAPWNFHNESNEYIYITVVPDENGIIDFCYEEIVTGWSKDWDDRSFEECVAAKKAEFEAYSKRLPHTTNEKYKEAFELANYMNWAQVMKNTGHFTNDREVILVSKNWMALAASWDNPFQFLPLYATDPKLAMDQILFLIDKQDATGAFPDWFNSCRMNYSSVKPPVFGAILNWLYEAQGIDLSVEDMQKIYEPMVKLVGYWVDYRDGDHDGILQYNSGNDAGDNCTPFDIAPNVEGADLQAYIVEMYCLLSRMAAKLGKEKEATVWQAKGEAHLANFLKHNYCEERKQFISPVAGTHQVAAGDCLLNYLPIMLADRLPKEIVENMVADLKDRNRFFTGHGFATESISSDKYLDNMYWRGSIWAPWNFMIIIGLMRAGEKEFAMEAMKGFCDMCANVGFAECFDAKRGLSQRDPTYTWSANLYQYFVKNYLE